MKVSTERLPDSQVMLELEVEDERVQKAIDSAYRKLAKRVKIPGFRPGKAPRAVIESHLGEETIRQEAIDDLMPQVYREALEQEQIDPIDRAQYELVTDQPLVAKFTVPVRPSVDLGDYRSLRLPREELTVEPERVEEGLESLRHRYATLEPVDRPVQWGDVVTADVEGTIDGSVFAKEEDAQFQLVEGRVISFPGFAEGLLGREKGAEFEFDVALGDDVVDSEGKPPETRTAHYKVTLKEVKQELLPDLDDEFARQAGEGFQSLEALRTRVQDDLREALEREERHKYEDEALEALAARATIEFPPIIVEREVERMLQEQAGAGRPASGGKASQGREELERLLQRVGKSEQEVRDELRPIAETRIRRSLVLSDLAEAENIEVTDADIEEEISRLAAGVSGQEDEVRRLFSTENAKESMRRSLVTRKTLDRLVEIASGEGPAQNEDQPAAAEAPAPEAVEAATSDEA